MSDKKIPITGFITVFEVKLDKLIKRIKTEYNKPKSERNKEGLKRLAQEAKSLRKLIKQGHNQESLIKVCCPECKHEFELDKKKL